MKKWTNRLLTIVGVVLILVAIYLFAKPHIDNYLHEKDNNDKIENYDKKKVRIVINLRIKHLKSLKINQRWQAILKCQMQKLKNLFTLDLQHQNN